MSESVIERAAGPVQLVMPKPAGPNVWSWLPTEEIEPVTLAQITNLAMLPCTTHVAVMPDAHPGYGMPIGCALATKNAVVPYAVGVDIGCGMVAVRTSVEVDAGRKTGLVDRGDEIRLALNGILERVPVGQPGRGRSRDAGSFTERQNSVVLREWLEATVGFNGETADGGERANIRERADRQLGTLGGGNHFIELQTDGEFLWLMLHTGSRAFGKWICDRYHKLALKWCERYYTPLPDKDLAFLALDSDEGQTYMTEMRFGLRYAEESRARIEAASLEAIRAAFGMFEGIERIETHHNFAAVERHLGKDVVVHRKGAVKTVVKTVGGALAGVPQSLLVTIPGSMQTGSYIGRGRPNKLALNTCAHGAGRTGGSRNAFRMANVGVDIKAEMEAGGHVLVTPPGADALDESGRAYKDIENVMRLQADLVEPVYYLRPLGVVKG